MLKKINENLWINQGSVNRVERNVVDNTTRIYFVGGGDSLVTKAPKDIVILVCEHQLKKSSEFNGDYCIYCASEFRA